jgi:hypothetical protein
VGPGLTSKSYEAPIERVTARQEPADKAPSMGAFFRFLSKGPAMNNPVLYLVVGVPLLGGLCYVAIAVLGQLLRGWRR